jgi:hypothetical protein
MGSAQLVGILRAGDAPQILVAGAEVDAPSLEKAGGLFYKEWGFFTVVLFGVDLDLAFTQLHTLASSLLGSLPPYHQAARAARRSHVSSSLALALARPTAASSGTPSCSSPWP